MRNPLIVTLIAGLVSCSLSLTGLAGPSSASQIPPHEQAIGNLILGEMALQQNQIDKANDYYLAAAKLSNDPHVAKQVVYLTLMSNNTDAALNAAKQWAALAPKNVDAQLITLSLLLKMNNTAAAIPYLQQALKIGNKNTIASIVDDLQDAPLSLQKSLLTSISQLPAKQQSDLNLQLATSVLQFQTGYQQQAIRTINNVLSKKPAWPQPIALKADFLIKSNQVNEAVNFVSSKAKQYPNQAMIQLIDVEMLLKIKQQNAAIAKLQTLKTLPETRGIALLTLAQLALEKKDIANAKMYLQEATRDPVHAGMAYYLLGEVYEFEHQSDQAIQAYLKVEAGQYYVTAQLKAALLLANNNKNKQALNVLSNVKINNMAEAQEVVLLQVQLLMNMQKASIALQVLNKAIVAIPNNVDLLYARSMVANTLHDSTQSENDLKQILKLDPNQITALNALGYLLTHTPARYQEALGYTQRALTLAPKNPAALDTMGWLQYRMGNYQSAYHYLNQAYEIDHDAVIAAHYGEILWHMGNKPAAKQIWQAALIKFPDNPDLLGTVKRFNSNNQ